MPNYKRGTISQDGEIEASIERYQDENSSVIRIVARFNEKIGILTFTTKEGDTKVEMQTDEFSVTTLDSIIAAGRESSMSGYWTMVNGEESLLLSGGKKVNIQAEQGDLEVYSAKNLKVGALRETKINSTKKVHIKSDVEIEIEAPKIHINGLQVILGKQGDLPVIMVGDTANTSSGTITGPGSTSVKVSR